jgi:hypothetical protein
MIRGIESRKSPMTTGIDAMLSAVWAPGISSLLPIRQHDLGDFALRGGCVFA